MSGLVSASFSMSHACVDLDSHGVVVDWQRHLQQHNCDCSGSFGVIYPGKLPDGSDVVVKFSAKTLHNHSQESQDTLNETLRCVEPQRRKEKRFSVQLFATFIKNIHEALQI